MKSIKGNYQRPDWRDLKYHEVAGLLPVMDADEFAGLVSSIAEVGQKEPITLFNDLIVDGRHRFRACLENDIEPWFRNFAGVEEDLKDYVFALNLSRRNMTDEQKLAIALELRKDGDTMDKIRMRLGISIGKVQAWMKEHFKGGDETRKDSSGRNRPTNYSKKEKNSPEETEEERVERRKAEAAESLNSWLDDFSDLDHSVLAIVLKNLTSDICQDKKKKK